ncbi:beach-domain-containing protein [Daedalea quercina L-15889]|uniref:Beach-domain-containing protein n=1 Tax=Daedalea quercina L-15889 TaxID=1314783 RepID=A0A165RC81_9APHY|nr:beach-domain-containing protein [Daedalea quercina L-15889]
MFRTLLTPLSARFSLSPLSPRPGTTTSFPQNGADDRPDDSLDPEEFARDVLIQLMRNAVENLKAAEGLKARAELLAEMHKVMLEDAATKDVFREMDGFLVVMSVLSTLQAVDDEEAKTEVLEATRLAFVMLSEALEDHPENKQYFKHSVGFESLGQAMATLVSDTATIRHTLGFLVSLGLHKFSMSGIFDFGKETDYAQLDHRIRDFEPAFGPIRHAEAFRLLFNFIPQASADGRALRYSILKLIERLSYHSHRNHCLLSSLEFVEPLFRKYCEWEEDADIARPERQLVQKLLRRLIDVGTSTDEARVMFQRAVREDGVIDADVLEVLRAGMKVKWPEHLSLENCAAIQIPHHDTRGLPLAGFTFMIWLWIEKLPTHSSHAIFSFRLRDRVFVALGIRPDGNLECQTAEVTKLKAAVHRARWTHITFIFHPHRSANPTVRIFIDGILTDALKWIYPKPEYTAGVGIYQVGDNSGIAPMSWSIASSYLFATTLADSLPRFIHHLSPRYASRFQTTQLARFFTYEASTALHIFIDGAAHQSVAKADITQLQHVVREGLSIGESSIVFSLSTSSELQATDTGIRLGFVAIGDIFLVKNGTLDSALWKIGGTAVALRLVQLASSDHQLSRALGVLTDGIRNSWQNSEDMERLRGYDILADLLRAKPDIINVTGFETLFEFLGLNFRSPDQSTIVNTVAYRAVALDFQLWASARAEIQRLHLEHFSTLLLTSKYKRFNVKHRFAKMGVARKLLFVMQTSLYSYDMFPLLLDALKVVAQVQFTANDAIKPIVSYLAANLHEVTEASSPRSIISRIDYSNVQSKAEQVLGMLISILRSPAAYERFSSALPVPRISLLLLGERPTPTTAALVLQLLTISVKSSSSFGRKFELVSGWNILKAVIPHAWDDSVQRAAFDLLLGWQEGEVHNSPVVVCPQILLAILAALKFSLGTVGIRVVSGTPTGATEVEDNVEKLLEELIEVHSSTPSFRQLFKSQATTDSLIDAYKSFVASASMAPELSQSTVRILEKLSHVGLSIALDNAVGNSQRQEIMDILQSAETALNPRTSQETAIDSIAVAGMKSRRRRMASIRLSAQLGESAVKRSITRVHDWRKTVIATERKRLRKTVLDLREYHRQISSLTDWYALLMTERGLWPSALDRRWQLDETEGPYRVRKKLEPTQEYRVSTKVEAMNTLGFELQIPSTSNGTPVLQLEVPPWAEGYDPTSTGVDERQLEEEIVEDKHRRVRHELEPDDVIELANTVARISGVDSSPGLLIFGQTHLYMLDGLVQNDDGEVIDAHDAPKRLFFVPGSIIELNGPQRAQRWSHEQIVSFSDRTFLFRDVGLEIYFKDSRSLLVVFLEKRQRSELSDRLSSILYRYSAEPPTPSPVMLKSPTMLSPMMGRLSGKLSASLSAKMLSGLRLDELSTAQRKWQTREISNFTYLSILNQISGRTPSDATQYPVFPWVIKDYTSEKLDLSSAESYRDLRSPMGALTPAREEAARSRYTNLESVGEKPFHYGTHFSSSMIVCHFLIRVEPFSHMFKTLQGGDWDLPERLFSDIRRAYESASSDVRGDVRELIPEFYALPEFLENSARIDFGVQQSTGERIDDVKMPPWAKCDPLLFIALHREALESDYVSENLPHWIDLIWGYKQRDPKSLNVFHPLSYEGSIDLDAITDELEREATVGIIHNFGQTPRKLFHTPHPERMMHGNSSLPIGTLYGVAEDYHLLSQSKRFVKDLGPRNPIRELAFDPIGQKMIPYPDGTACVPGLPHERVVWRPGLHSGGDLRAVVDNKVVQVIESTACSCAVFADPSTLVTGSRDYTVRLWRVQHPGQSLNSHKEPPLNITLTHVMRAHTSDVICVTASRAWSVVVSGSKDGSAAFWDLNRGTYVRSVWHGEGDGSSVHLVTVNESTGYVASCSRSKLWLHTVNGRPIVWLDLISSTVPNSYPAITSIAFLEREYSRVGVLATGSPDGTIALRTWNADSTPEGEKAHWEFMTLKTLIVKDPDGHVQPKGRNACVTALKFVGECLYHGEDSGRTFSWDLPD